LRRCLTSGKSNTRGSLLSSTDDTWQNTSGSFDTAEKGTSEEPAIGLLSNTRVQSTNQDSELDQLAIMTDQDEKLEYRSAEQSPNPIDQPILENNYKSDGFNNKENGRKSVVDREEVELEVKVTKNQTIDDKETGFEHVNYEDVVNPEATPSLSSYSSLGLLGREATFDYVGEEEGSVGGEAEDDKKTDISEEIDEMLASFNNITTNIRKQVEGITEDSILFSMYGNQGPVHSFCRVQGDGDLSSLLCAGGIGFDSFEVKGLKNMRRKDVINATSPNDTCLLSQLLMWSYCRRAEEEK